MREGGGKEGKREGGKEGRGREGGKKGRREGGKEGVPYARFLSLSGCACFLLPGYQTSTYTKLEVRLSGLLIPPHLIVLVKNLLTMEKGVGTGAIYSVLTVREGIDKEHVPGKVLSVGGSMGSVVEQGTSMSPFLFPSQFKFLRSTNSFLENEKEQTYRVISIDSQRHFLVHR
jgi:hypothetical protein